MVVVGAGEPSPRALTASESELVLRRLLRIVAEVAQECKRREASSSAAEAQGEAARTATEAQLAESAAQLALERQEEDERQQE